MPTLSQKTLDKMFECPYCEKLFRTRNGLSGHIQFKHAENAYCSEKNEADYYPNVDEFETDLRSNPFLNERDIQLMITPLREWELVKEVIGFKNIKSEKNHFPMHQLMVYALLGSEKRLGKWMKEQFDRVNNTLEEIQSDIERIKQWKE